MASTAALDHSQREREPLYYDVVSGLFVAVYLISQVASAKLFTIGNLQLPGAIILFPVAYIFGDILTEVYGYARARRVIWIGFASAVLLALTLLVVERLPPAPSWGNQEAYTRILGFVPRVVLGSVLAYFVGEFANSFVLAKMKLLTNGRYLWSRTIGSTIVGQALDSSVFAAVAFGGLIPPRALLSLAVSIYVVKVLYEALATPLTYLTVAYLKNAEGLNVFDRNTDFSPFTLKR